MKYLSFASLILALAATGLGINNRPQADTDKLGYVRTGVVIERVEIAAQARAKLTDERDEITNNLKQLEEEMATAHETFMAGQAQMSDEDRTKRVSELAEQEKSLVRYRQESGKMMQGREQEVMAPAFQILNARIAKFAEQNGYAIVLGTLADGNILYGDQASDVTEEVISYVNSKK